ncbi:MAG: GGDEF domain-containing protein [Burkholderiaceae bacterium]|nr:MAG: GGDEF domain-containing protein [Burkholderiaceae bacterium]
MKNQSDSSEFSPADGEIALEIVDHTKAMLAYWNASEICLFANNAFEEWFGKTRVEMIGISMRELLGDDYPKIARHIEIVLAGKTEVYERAISLPDGSQRDSLITFTPNFSEGVVQGFFAHVVDVSPLKRLERELKAAKESAEKLATHDFLTGLPNRVLLEDRIQSTIQRAQRNGKPLAVISVDIDNFKQINDTHGHAVGDCALQEIARRLRHAMRESDTVTRMGGDEFIVLIPELDSTDDLDLMIQRIFNASNTPLACLPGKLPFSFSVGVALYPEDGNSPKELMLASDRALYRAKKLGKNRHAFSETSDDLPAHRDARSHRSH